MTMAIITQKIIYEETFLRIRNLECIDKGKKKTFEVQPSYIAIMVRICYKVCILCLSLGA
jgi:hypothetical protein